MKSSKRRRMYQEANKDKDSDEIDGPVSPDSLVDSLMDSILEQEDYEGGIDLCEFDRLLSATDTLIIRMRDYSITHEEIDEEMGWDGSTKKLMTTGRPNPAYLVRAGIAIGKLIERKESCGG